MKIKMKSGVRRYKPARVVNPVTEFHTTRLFPCQSFVLKLRKPVNFLSACSTGAYFDVSILSDMLIIEQIEEDLETGDKVYTIGQKYNLAEWVEYGEVALGDVLITLCDNSHPDATDFLSTICV